MSTNDLTYVHIEGIACQPNENLCRFCCYMLQELYEMPCLNPFRLPRVGSWFPIL